MHKLLSLLFAALLYTPLFAQIEKSQWLLSCTGQYQRENRDGIMPSVGSGVTYNVVNETRVTSAQFTPALGYALRKRWVIGGGMGIQDAETKVNPEHKKVNMNLGTGTFLVEANGRTTENNLSPFVFGEYIHPLGQKLNVSTLLSASYSFLKNKSRSGYYVREPLTGNLSTAQISETAYRTESYVLRFSPTLRYQMFPHFGLQLGCGGFRLYQKMKDSRLPAYEQVKPSFGFDAAPKNWELGVYVNR